MQAGNRQAGLAANLLVVLLVFAPLVRGGNRPLAELVIQTLSLALALTLAWGPALKIDAPRSLLFALTALALIPLLQLIPLPFAFWQELPGREYYAEALRRASGGRAPEFLWRPAALVLFSAERSWLALLPPLSVFLAGVGLPRRRLKAVVVLSLGIAAAEALLGLMQFGAGSDSLLRLNNPWYTDSATGTYTSRNHFAGLLEMFLPVGLALLAASVGKQPAHWRLHRRSRLRSWLDKLSSAHGNRTLVYAAACLAILLGLIFSRSRAGVLAAMGCLALCLIAFSRRLGGNNAFGLVGTFSAIGLGMAAEIGLVPVIERFTLQDPLADARWSLFSATVQAIGQFFPIGAGGGSFAEIFSRFQPPDLVGFFKRAHNDYLEWVLEGGIAVMLLLLVIFAAYLRQWFRLWRSAAWPSFRFVQIGAGIGLLLILLHSAVDFNLHIPANALFFAVLAAAFFRTPGDEEIEPENRHVSSRDRSRRGFVPPDPAILTIAPENRRNPFAE